MSEENAPEEETAPEKDDTMPSAGKQLMVCLLYTSDAADE